MQVVYLYSLDVVIQDYTITMLLKASCLMLELKEFRCYEAKIEETQKASSSWESNSRVGGHLAVMAQWQSAGGSSQRCSGFDS